MFKIWGLIFGCENGVVEEVFGSLLRTCLVEGFLFLFLKKYKNYFQKIESETSFYIILHMCLTPTFMNNFQNTEKSVAFIVFDLFIVMPLKTFFGKHHLGCFQNYVIQKKKFHVFNRENRK